MVVDGIVEPMELGHLPYKKGTYEDYVGAEGMRRLGKKKWRKVERVREFGNGAQRDDLTLIIAELTS